MVAVESAGALEEVVVVVVEEVVEGVIKVDEPLVVVEVDPSDITVTKEEPELATNTSPIAES